MRKNNDINLPTSGEDFVPLFDGGINNHSSDERYFICSYDCDSMIMGEFLQSNNIKFKSVVGQFNGITEPSLVINTRNWKTLYKSGLMDNQSSVLYLGTIGSGYVQYGVRCRTAFLYYLGDVPDDKDISYDVFRQYRKDLGYLLPTNKSNVKEYEDYTVDYSTGIYYVTRM